MVYWACGEQTRGVENSRRYTGKVLELNPPEGRQDKENKVEGGRGGRQCTGISGR